jgi:adhesin/invasin
LSFDLKINNSKFLLLTPLVLATTVTFANWGADSEEVSVNQATTNDEDRSAFIDLTTMIAAGDIEGAQSQVIEAATDQGVGFTQSFLEKYFPTVEVSFGAADGEKPTAGLLIVAPLTDKEDIFNTVFTQVSGFYQDNRTTLNLGLGYRHISDNKKFLYGINAFYDHEFPYDHGRTSVGVEAMSTMWEIRGNKYWATTDWKTGKHGQQERALDGYDLEAGIPLPYMNWATVFIKHFKWDAYDGADDLEGQDLSFRAQFPGFLTGLEVEAGRSFYKDYRNESFVKMSYNLTEIFKEKKSYREPWINKTAFRLESVEHKRFEKVRRENLIVKQTRGNLKVVTR